MKSLLLLLSCVTAGVLAVEAIHNVVELGDGSLPPLQTAGPAGDAAAQAEAFERESNARVKSKEKILPSWARHAEPTIVRPLDATHPSTPSTLAKLTEAEVQAVEFENYSKQAKRHHTRRHEPTVHRLRQAKPVGVVVTRQANKVGLKKVRRKAQAKPLLGAADQSGKEVSAGQNCIRTTLTKPPVNCSGSCVAFDHGHCCGPKQWSLTIINGRLPPWVPTGNLEQRAQYQFKYMRYKRKEKRAKERAQKAAPKAYRKAPTLGRFLRAQEDLAESVKEARDFSAPRLDEQENLLQAQVETANVRLVNGRLKLKQDPAAELEKGFFPTWAVPTNNAHADSTSVAKPGQDIDKNRGQTISTHVKARKKVRSKVAQRDSLLGQLQDSFEKQIGEQPAEASSRGQIGEESSALERGPVEDQQAKNANNAAKNAQVSADTSAKEAAKANVKAQKEWHAEAKADLKKATAEKKLSDEKKKFEKSKEEFMTAKRVKAADKAQADKEKKDYEDPMQRHQIDATRGKAAATAFPHFLPEEASPFIEYERAQFAVKELKGKAGNLTTQANTWKLVQAQQQLKLAYLAYAQAKASKRAGYQCNGNAQSPIDIPPRKMRSTAQTLFSKLSVYYVPVRMGAYGHGTEKYARVQRGEAKIAVGRQEYQLKRVTIKSPSEHTISGKRFAMELQFLHTSTFNPTDHAVISAMYQVNPNPTEPGNVFVQAAIDAHKTKTTNYTDPLDGLPENTRYFHYEGSLTSPPCTQQTQWYVMSEPGSITQTQLVDIRTALQLDTANTVVLFDASQDASYVADHCCQAPCGSNARPMQRRSFPPEIVSAECQLLAGPKSFTCEKSMPWA